MKDQRVYFLEDKQSGLVKIGTTGDLAARKKAIEYQVGRPLNLIADVPGDRWLEQTLHEAFSDIRQMGEWFLDASHLRSYIAVLVGLASGDIPVSKPDPFDIHYRPKPKEGWVTSLMRLGKTYERAAACANCQMCAEHGGQTV